MPNYGAPDDVIVADHWNAKGGQKAVVGFTCSHVFIAPDGPDEDTDPDEHPSGPLYYGRSQKGGSAVVEIWTGGLDGLISSMDLFGVPMSAESIAAVEQVAANAGC